MEIFGDVERLLIITFKHIIKENAEKLTFRTQLVNTIAINGLFGIAIRSFVPIYGKRS
jgi:hypothetical protein